MESKLNKYKIYIETKFGYEVKGIFTLEKMHEFLDEEIIEKEKKNKILVVENDGKSEFPYYIFTGDMVEYLTYRSDFIFEDKPKKRKKEIK